MLKDPAADLRLDVRAVTKLFGTTVALWRVDLEATAGQFVLVHGSNGSGKTTLVRTIADLTSPTAGEITWSGMHRRARPRMAYVGHASGLFDGLTPYEHLTLAARLARTDPAHAMSMLDRLGAARVAGVACGGLSAGMRRRVALARAFGCGSEVILLDEPLAALDEAGITSVVDLISEAAREGRLVLGAAPSDDRLKAIAVRTVTLVDGHALRSLARSESRAERVEAR
jgi:ABC-type multidrug transport system ATPase subunit